MTSSEYGGSNVLPPPPRPALYEKMLTDLGRSSDGYRKLGESGSGKNIHHFPAWRLRWCAACLVIAVTMQASTVGAQMQMYFGAEQPAAGAQSNMITSLIMLSVLVTAMWSLLSQLLLWSDAAVMKVPEGVRVSGVEGSRSKGDVEG